MGKTEQSQQVRVSTVVAPNRPKQRGAFVEEILSEPSSTLYSLLELKVLRRNNVLEAQ